MSTSFSGESRVCRVCGQSYPANSPTCPRCGYTPSSSAPDVEGGWKQKIPLPARPNISRVALVALVVGLILPLTAALLVVVSISKGVRGGVERVDRPGDPDPAPADPGPNEARENRCERRMVRYLRDLSRSFGKSNATAALFIEASNEFGPGSARYRALIDIYGDVEVNTLMAQGKNAQALRRARPPIRAACAR